MKFKQHLRDNIAPEYGPHAYLDYRRLDDIIRVLSGDRSPVSADPLKRQISLTAPPTKGRAPQTAKTLTEEAFCVSIDAELIKVESFTLFQVQELREKLGEVESALRHLDMSNEDKVHELRSQGGEIAKSFLRLEKYVNVNFMGFHKILKKHDRHVPESPCKSFYVSRMHAQAWVRGDYSDVVVRLSAIFSALRNDRAAEENVDPSQSFLRSTSKYWIKTADVSTVKCAILRHLPVFLQKTATGESDSQLINSVYLDNDQLELYHTRLVKLPGSINLRLRWYGNGAPQTVFVERKTHREKWTGKLSSKERFMIKEEEVEQIMNDRYPIAEKKREMTVEKGASQVEADNWEKLAREVTQVVAAKQLVPTVRTQCMRTAFQIPFDATVRISLDTNLCMISERGYDLKQKTVWHRDPNQILAPNEITRFPHAILEIKLQLAGDELMAPQWVTDLQKSGLLYECHKFSKFIHGCCTLLPEDVQYVPYWIDDVSLRGSIVAAGGGQLLVQVESDMRKEEEKKKKKKKQSGVGPGANEIYDHLLPFGDVVNNRMANAVGRTGASCSSCEGRFLSAKTKQKLSNGVNVHDSANIKGEKDGLEEKNSSFSWGSPFCSPARQHYRDVLASMRPQEV